MLISVFFLVLLFLCTQPAFLFSIFIFFKFSFPDNYIQCLLEAQRAVEQPNTSDIDATEDAFQTDYELHQSDVAIK